MLKIRLRFSLQMMFVAVSVVAVLFGGLIWFEMFLSRIPEGVEQVSEITPTSSGEKVAFVTYHGGYDDKWSGVRNFIAQHTGHNTYPESVRLTLLDISSGKTSDLGAGELAGRPIAWTNDESWQPGATGGQPSMSVRAAQIGNSISSHRSPWPKTVAARRPAFC